MKRCCVVMMYILMGDGVEAVLYDCVRTRDTALH